MLVDKKSYKGIIGEVEFHLDKKSGMFTFKYPTDVIYAQASSPVMVATYAEIVAQCDEAIKLYLQGTAYKRDIIAISLASSTIKEDASTYRGLGSADTGALTSYGCAVGLNWVVLAEYGLKYQHLAGSDYAGLDKNRCTVYKQRWEIKEKVMYKPLRASKYYGRIGEGFSEQRDIFNYGTGKRIFLPYSKETEDFLRQTEEGMEHMVERVTAFFTQPEDRLLAGMLGGNLLGAGK